MAVNVALSKYLDAVVVEDGSAARACVRYLKERMLPPMTFLPLADLRAGALDPRLQNLVQQQRGLRLALNCVAFDEKYAKAFGFMLHDVVVVGGSRPLEAICRMYLALHMHRAKIYTNRIQNKYMLL